MVAFCIIVGDTIPHVFAALFPSLRNMSFLWLLADRRAVIVLFVLSVSYPLSLYRDIAKVIFGLLRITGQLDDEDEILLPDSNTQRRSLGRIPKRSRYDADFVYN
jgi:hypothetical protein